MIYVCNIFGIFQSTLNLNVEHYGNVAHRKLHQTPIENTHYRFHPKFNFRLVSYGLSRTLTLAFMTPDQFSLQENEGQPAFIFTEAIEEQNGVSKKKLGGVDSIKRGPVSVYI